MARILLVDDDVSLLDVVGMSIVDAGHQLSTAKDGVSALEVIARDAPDLVVSDVNMPRLDGFALCRKLRESGHTVPLVLLTSRDGEIDEALGLELGADDYVTKPFSTRVLLARIDALLRRDRLRHSAEASATTVVCGHLVLEPERIEARYRGTTIVLTLSEFRLLEALARNEGRVLSRDRLLELMRGDDSVVEARIVDTYIRRLRRKLEAIDATCEAIETVIGAGYRMRAESA